MHKVSLYVPFEKLSIEIPDWIIHQTKVTEVISLQLKEELTESQSDLEMILKFKNSY